MTKILITVDSATRKAKVSGDRVYIGDSTVSVTVNGIDEENLASLKPNVQLVSYDGIVCADAALTANGGTLTGNLNTNTVQFAREFDLLPFNAGKPFIVRIFSTTAAEPLGIGQINVYKFPDSGSGVPVNLPTAGEAFDEVNRRVEELGEKIEKPLKGEAYVSPKNLNELVTMQMSVARTLGASVT